nr:chitobiase/beta-hexosaminidase C-terminal domain-containing protein [uncultured Desulfobacter sp.]
MKRSKLILFISVFIFLSVLVQAGFCADSCSFDFENDGDVDGKDVFLFSRSENPTLQDYSDLAAQFGKTGCMITAAPQITFHADPQITNGTTSATLSWTALYTDSMTIEPGIGEVTGTSSVVITPAQTTEYTLTAVGNGGQSQSKVTVSVDTVPPNMIDFYPANGSVIAASGEAITLLGTFGDNLAGIKSVTLLNEENTDITSSATVTASTITYILSPIQEKQYSFTLTLEDNVSNSKNFPIIFQVDKTAPVTTPSVASGRYSSRITLNLTASEDATVYYSTDGYPPFVGASNTKSSPSPASGIIINSTTRVQFFSVDAAGNRESTKAADYMFTDIPASVTGLTAIFSPSPKQVYLSWNQNPDAQKYYIYRCMNFADRIILLDSRTNGYPPPKKLKIAETSGNTPDFTDNTNLVDGASYYYGATYIDSNGIESVISDLAQTTITTQDPAETIEDAAERAAAWLENNQQSNGSWGTEEKCILATSQTLDGLKAKGVENAGIFQALSFLRAVKADNTDYLARKIVTLSNHGQNADRFVSRLISKSYIYNAQIYGWGIDGSFMVDALDTALGTKALACLSIELKDSEGASLADLGEAALEQWAPLQGPENNKYGWVPGQDISAFVSAAAYSVTNPGTGVTQWLSDLQQVNGSFEDNITDTAGVLIWVPDIIPDKTAAQLYLVAGQNINGSWGDDPYLTGLCLEALLK